MPTGKQWGNFGITAGMDLLGGLIPSQPDITDKTTNKTTTTTPSWQNAPPGFLEKFMSGGSDVTGFLQNVMKFGSPVFRQASATAWSDLGDVFNKFSGAGQRTLFKAGYGTAPSGFQAAMSNVATREAGSRAADLTANLAEKNWNTRMDAAKELPGALSLFNPRGFTGGTETSAGQEHQEQKKGTNWGGIIGGIGTALLGLL